MNFTTIEYIAFLFGLTILFYSIRPSYRIYLLLLAGYFFYAQISWVYCLLLFFMSLYSYWAGIWIERNAPHKLSFGLCLFLLLFPMLFFKLNNTVPLQNLIESTFTIEMAFPIGISFYTFQMVSYLVDIKRGYISPERNLAKALLHHAFFPILLAGPIERAKKLLSQFDFKIDFDYNTIRNGFFQILWGIFKKMVVADNLAFYVHTIYKNLSKCNGFEVYLAMLFFVFQIIMDFSAYTDIAMGSAKLFGVKITKNIHDRAYASTSRTELWQQWHVSLTTWLRDYIFFPLTKFSKKQSWLYGNILIVYFISGLWHGASWGFILWGLGNGIWLIAEQVTKKKRFIFFDKIGILHRPLLFNAIAWLIFINTSAFFDVLFFSKNWTEILSKFSQLLVNQPFGYVAGKKIVVICFFTLFIIEIANRIKKDKEIYELLPKNIPLRWLIYLSLSLSIFYFNPSESSSFMYFNY